MGSKRRRSTDSTVCNLWSKTGEGMTNPTWFCGTIWKHLCDWTLEQVAEWLKQHHAKEGVVGLEISPTSGKEHYQFKIHLDRGETLEGWKKLIGPIGHVDVAIDKNFRGYEEKDGIFIKWPTSPLEKYKELKLRTWQADVVETFEKQDERRILVIVDKQGGNGKSYLSRYMEATGKADVCPVISDEYNDYSAYCLDNPCKGYVFDLPRATSIKRRSAMWMGIEQIKNGLLYEKRYKPRKLWIEPPKVLVFTNDDIPWEMLSADRWEAYELYNGWLYQLKPEETEE